VTVQDEANAIAGDIAELRHALHREPELGLDLPKTQAKVLDALGGLPLSITPGERVTAVTAVLRGDKPGPTVLLRGDMDALPVKEETGLDYASRIDGAMHACGHDLHTAMLAGAARILSARKAELAGNVIFMFQPGEEGFHGARYMLDEGVLEAAGPERPTAAYGMHVMSGLLPHGAFGIRPGAMLAAVDTLHVTVIGRGGHASSPHNSADPIPAACEMVTALQTMVTRRFDVFDPVVLTVGSFHAGTKDNIIPDDARFDATVRTFSPQARERAEEESQRVVREIAKAHGLRAETEYEPGYPVTLNDETEAEFTAATVGDVFGSERSVRRRNPITGAEDFSYVLEQVPGAFVFLGATPAGKDWESAPTNHSNIAVFDDDVLADGTALYAELALRRLRAAGA
jgi:amidohydrolase